MDDDERRGLVRGLAELAGRPLPEVEVEAVLRFAREADRQTLNGIWRTHKRAPATVPFRHYLAMTLRFIETAKEPPSPGLAS